MFHLIFWFAQGIFFVVAKIFFYLLMLFIMSSLFYAINLLKLNSMLHLTYAGLPFIFLTQPYLTSGITSSIFLTVIYFLDPTPYSRPKVKLWKLMVENLKIAMKVRSALHVPDRPYFFLRRLKNTTLMLSSLLLAAMYCSAHQIFMMILIAASSSTALLVGMSASFFSSFISLPFSKSPDTSPPMLVTSPTDFAVFLKNKMDEHPLGAMIEESFYEDNLQMGDFFLAYPIFFKTSSPGLTNPPIDKEILSLWHTIRWESAFSKQTGSATSRWISLYGVSFTSMPLSAHSVHTPLIPVFNDEIFAALEKANLPTFDPFNQLPEWSPYSLTMTSLGWSEEEMKEERLVEMEEED